MRLIPASRAGVRWGLRSEQYKSYQKLFSMQVDEFSNLDSLEKSCTKRYNVWKLLLDFETNTHSWTTDSVQTLDINVITAEVDNAATTAFKMGKADKEDRVVRPSCQELAQTEPRASLRA